VIALKYSPSNLATRRLEQDFYHLYLNPLEFKYHTYIVQLIK